MRDKKRILLFSDWFEPGYKAGGPIQSCKNTVNKLSDEFDFWIFTSDRDLGDTEPYNNIEVDTWMTLPNSAHVFYASKEFLGSANMRKMILQVQPDTVYLNSMFSSYYSLLPLWILRGIKFSGRIVLAPRGMLTTSAVSRKKWKKKMFLALFALSSVSKKIFFHATCTQEEKDIKSFFGSRAQVQLIDEIPNSFDKWTPRTKLEGHINIVFISRIHPIKNLLYAINIVKRIKGRAVVFDIYGPVEDLKYFEKCKESASEAHAHISINFNGPIPNSNIFALLQNYHVFFLPTLGENFGHVIFEALTCGCVLLISNTTPWKELQQENVGWDIPLNDKFQYEQKLSEVCDMKEDFFNEKSRAAFNYAQNFIASMNLKTKYTALFEPTA